MLSRKQLKSGTGLVSNYSTLGYKYSDDYGGTTGVVSDMINCDIETRYKVMKIYVMTTAFCSMEAKARWIKNIKKNVK